ncbi:MAG: hypothetical protein LBV72_05875 [Tannerella sp.]|jgi:hypothetical protein|nr:hypothetical protein [Tannerella sp.]
MNEIIVPHGVKDKLIKQFNTSYPTVRAALRGKSKSLLCLRIRKAALDNGGVEVATIDNNNKYVIL